MSMSMYAYISVCANKAICNNYDHSVFFSDFRLWFCIFLLTDSSVKSLRQDVYHRVIFFN